DVGLGRRRARADLRDAALFPRADGRRGSAVSLRTRPIAIGLVALSIAFVAACGSGTPSPALLSRGDTLVRSHGAVGAWGPARAATELLRMVPQRPEEDLAEVTDIAALPDGGVVVFDAQGAGGPALREFDVNGRYVRT